MICLIAGLTASCGDPQTAPDEWAAARRETLPLFQVTEAAQISELAEALPVANLGNAWSRSQADSANTRYSTLTQINNDNVAQLDIAWVYHSRDGAANVQANPIVVGDTLFAPTAGGRLVALEAATGREKWSYRPPASAGRIIRPAHRGLVYDAGNGKRAARLYFMVNHDLYALDPQSGMPVTTFGTRGRTSVREPAGRGPPVGITPVILGDLIVTAYRSTIEAFSATDGRSLWRFNTLTYPPKNSSIDNGGNVWGGLALDENRRIVFAAVGNPKRDFVGVDRPGDNRHTNSVVALNLDDGRLLWSFQNIIHDLWDMDVPAPPNLVAVRRGGRLVDAVAQVTKQGNTLLLDRVTGKPLFPFRRRRAPLSEIPDEITAPYQPDLELPEPFARPDFREDDITDLNPEAHAEIAERLSGARHGWFVPTALGKPTVFFGIHGGAEWTGAAFDPTSGLLYVTANHVPWIIELVGDDGDAARWKALADSAGGQIFQANCSVCHGSNGEGQGMAPPVIGVRKRLSRAQVTDVLAHGRGAMPTQTLEQPDKSALLEFLFAEGNTSRWHSPWSAAAYSFKGFTRFLDPSGYPGSKPPWGTLNAIDLNSGRILWRTPLGEYPELTKLGISPTGTENFGGATVTAGHLVFAAGTRDNMIRAFDARTGRELWKHTLPFGGFAPPTTYSVDGRQFIVIAATGGGKLGGEVGDTYVAFALPGQVAGRR